MSPDHADLPANLPCPPDDGLADHLLGFKIPSNIILPSTSGTDINLSTLLGRTIVYCYPKMGDPDKPATKEWNETPGARGCTAENKSYKHNYSNLKASGADQIFGLSTQDISFQKKAKTDMHLPFDLLSAKGSNFQKGLNMPVFLWDGEELITRCTLSLRGGEVEHVWYPVSSPVGHSAEVVSWLREKDSRQSE